MLRSRRKNNRKHFLKNSPYDGSRIVPSRKNILSGGRHLLCGGRHLLSGGRHLVIWRPPLNYKFLEYCRYGVKHYIIFSMMEINTAAALYFHMGFLTKKFCIHLLSTIEML